MNHRNNRPGTRRHSAATKFSASLLYGTALLLLSACTSHTSVSSTWEGTGDRAGPFSRVLIVAMTPDPYRQKRFEDEMLESLISPTTQAWTFSSLTPVGTKVERSVIEKLAQDKNADAVIVTKLSSSDVSAKETGDRVIRKEVMSNPTVSTGSGYDFTQYETHDYFRGYKTYDEAGYLKAKITIVLTTQVYETKGGNLVYTATSEARNQEAIYTAIDLLSDLVTKQLISDRVTR